MDERHALDDAMVSIVVTALLIRLGGKVVLSAEEWDAAIERAASLYCHRDGEDQEVMVVLMPKGAYA